MVVREKIQKNKTLREIAKGVDPITAGITNRIDEDPGQKPCTRSLTGKYDL